MSYFGDYNGGYFEPYFGEEAPRVDLSETIAVTEAVTGIRIIPINLPDVWEFGFGQGGPPPS